MAIKRLLTSGGRVDGGAGDRYFGGRWSVAWMLLAAVAVLLVMSAGPMGLPAGLVYAQDEAANSEANASENQAEAQPAEEQPAEAQPAEGQEQSEPAQGEAGAAPEAVEGEMTEEEANRLAEEVIRELDEKMANDPEFARQVREQEAMEAQRAVELEAEQQQFMEREAEQERLQQEQRMAELEAEQQAFAEQERQPQGLPTVGPQAAPAGEGQPAAPQAVPPSGSLEHPPGRSLQHPTGGTVTPRPIDRLREMRERRKAAAGQPSPTGESHPGAAPAPAGAVPNEAAASPGDMRLDARNLPDVSQRELEALKNRIVKTTPQQPTTGPAAARPGAPITGTAGVPAVGPEVPVPAPPGATVPKDLTTGTPDLKSQPKWWVLKAEDRPYFFAWKNTPLDRTCQDLCEMSGLSMMGLNMLQPATAKPLTFQSVKIMDYDEALLTFDLLIADQGYWVLRRDDYLEIRPLNEWSRYVSPARMYSSVEEYRQAKVPPWELVSVIYEPKERSAEVLQAGVVALVPINTTWASVIPNTNRLEIRSFAYYLDKQMEWLQKNDLDMGGDGRELRVYVLKHSSPESAANLLQTMLPPSEVPPSMSGQVPGQPVRPGSPRTPTPQPQAGIAGGGGSTADMVEITEDSRLNRLLVRATASKHEMVKEYLDKYIDLPLEGGESELIKLAHSDPATLVEMIKPMLVEQQVIQTPVPPQPNQPQPQPGRPPMVPRVVMQASNAVLTPIDHMKAILVKAEPDDMAKIKQYVQMLDVPQEEAKHHYVTLEHASATSVASILNDALGVGSSYRRTIGVPSTGRQDFKAIPDLSNDRSLVILGESKDVEDAKALIAKLDVDPQVGASQHLVRLKSAVPSSVSAVLQSRFGGTSGGGGGGAMVYHRGGTYRGGAGGGGSLPQFIADDESKMLIVVCGDKEWPQIEALMKELDASAEVANTTKAYRLKHASAANLSNILSQSFGSGRGGYRSYGGSSPGGPSFQYEPGGNVLLVTANDEVHTKVADLIRELDQPTSSAQAELRVIELEKAEAEYVAGKLEELLGAESSSRYSRGGYRGEEGAPKVPVQIVAESVGNRILITSSEEDFKKAEDLAKQIDKEYATQEFERRTFVLAYAPASQIRMAVEAMFGSGGGSRYSRYGYGSSSSTPGAIKISDVGNGLVVLAPKSKMEEIAALIEKLDTDPASKNEIRTYKVEGAGRTGTAEVARNLEQLYGGSQGRGGAGSGVKFIGSYGSDLLMVSAPPEKMGEITKTVDQMLAAKTSEDLSLVIKHYEIKQATPQDVAEMIEPILRSKYQELQEKSGERSGGYYGYGMGGPMVTAHKTGARLLVAAPQQLLPLVEQLIAEFDRPAEQSTMVIVALTTAKAEEIAPVVQQQVSGGTVSDTTSYRSRHSRYSHVSMGDTGSESGTGGLSVTPVASSNLLIVRGPEDKVAEAQKMIQELDAKARPDGPMVKVYQLKFADVYDVTSTLEEIVGGGSSGYGGYSSSGYGGSDYGRRGSSYSGGVVIQSDVGNRIIVSAPADKIPIVDQIVDLKEKLAEEESQTTAEAGIRGDVLSVDRKDGSITKSYDVKGSSEEIARYLDRILIERYGYFDSPYVKSFSFDNQVIVTGRAEQFKEVERLLEKLEQTKLPTRVGLAFKRVKSGNVARIVEMVKQYAPVELQEKINIAPMPRAAGQRSPMEAIREVRWNDPIRTEVSEQPAVAPFVAPAAGARELERLLAGLHLAQGVKVTVATRPATSPGTQPAPAAVKPAVAATQPAAASTQPEQKLDRQERVERVVELRNRPAKEVAKAIKGFFEEAAGESKVGLEQIQRLISVQEGAEGSNTLVVSYDPRIELQVLNMIKQLDQVADLAPAAATQPAPVRITVAAPTTQPAAAQSAPVPGPIAAAPASPGPASPAPAPPAGVAAATPQAGPAGSEEISPEEQDRLAIQQAAMQAYTTQQTQIKYDEENKLIYMIGPASDLEKLDEVLGRILEQFEEIEEPTDSNVKVYRMQYLDVSIAATILEQMFNEPRVAAPKQPKQPKQPGKETSTDKTAKEKGKGEEEEEGAPGARRREEEKAQAEEQAQQMTGGQRIRVFPNPRDQTLVVRAAKEDYPLIVELLLKIDRPSDRPPVDIQIFQLKHLNAQEVEQAIKTILKIDQGVRSRGMVRRPLVGRGVAGAMTGMDAMIDQLEQEMLEMEAAGLLGGLEAGQPGEAQAAGEGKGTLKINPAKDITIASDATTNSIMVMAPQEGMKLVKKLIDRLEEQDIPTRIEPFTLQYADATKLAGELEKLFQSRGGSQRDVGSRLMGVRPSALGTITVASDARTNTIVVRALEPDMEKVRPIIKELDHPPSDQQVQVYTVEHGDAKQMALTLQTIFVQDPSAVGARAVRITADVETNSIVVSAPEAQQTIIADRIKLLDARVGEWITPRQIQLKVANPSNVAAKLMEIFGSRGGRTRSGKNEINLAGDDGSKILFVTAPPEIYAQIEQLAMMMDKSATQDIRVIALKNANAVEVLTRFKEMMGQIYQQAGKGTINEVFAATADERTNSLIVAGTPAVFEAVTKVLTDLDVAPSDENIITTAMFPLVRGSSSSVVAAINALYAGRPNIGGVPAPRATAEPVANVVYITGTKSQIDQLKATVIDPLEQYAPAVALMSYQIPIKYAKVEDVAETLNNWFTQRFGALRAAGGTAKAPAELVVNIIAEPATKQLLVSCSEGNKAIIDELLKLLDNEQVTDLGQQVKVISVKYADLGYTAQALTAAFTKTGKVPESEKITITPEYGTQSLIIKARATDIGEIEKLLAQIDRSDSTNLTPPETIRLQHARASEVSNTVTQMVQRTKRRDRTSGLYPVNVSGDDTSNTVLLTASNRKEMDEVKALIQQLDTQPATDIERSLQSYPLLYADLGSVMQAINTRFADNARLPVQHQVSVIPDYTTNALLVTASPENHKKVEVIIKGLDQSNVASMRAPETIKVVNIKASDLANTLNLMIRTSKKVDKRTGQYPVTVAGNDASSTLLVTANATDMTEMKVLIAKLDVPMDEADQRIINPYPVKYVDLNAVIQVINSRFEGNKSRSVKDQVQAMAEPATNSVVVTASAENHEKVKALIEQLDQESGGTVQQEIIRLTNARADDLSTVVQTTYRSRKLRPGEQPPTITADTNSNSIVVSASLNQIQAIKELIAELDKPVDPSRVEELRVIPLQYVDVTEVKDILTEYLRKPGVAPGRGAVGLVNDIRLQVSPSMNALVVSGASADIERVQTLTQTMDKEDLAGSSAVPQIVQVQNTSASQLATTLSRMFTEPAQLRTRGKTGGADLVPLIMADDATNTLVVKARTVDFNQIKETVAKLDTERAGPSGIEVIPVSRGTNVSALAREIERTINQGELVKARQQPGYKPAAVAIGMDERGPALIVAGSPELFPTIRSLVAKLQSFTPAGGYTARIIPVRNIPAQDMKRVIQQLIDQQQGGGQSGRPRR